MYLNHTRLHKCKHSLSHKNTRALKAKMHVVVDLGKDKVIDINKLHNSIKHPINWGHNKKINK